MEVVEGLGGILTGDLTQNHLTTGVSVYKVCYIVDFVIDDDPEVILGGVLK